MNAARTPVPQLIRALEIPDSLQVCVHKLALYGLYFDRSCMLAILRLADMRLADLHLAPPESPEREAGGPLFHLAGAESAVGVPCCCRLAQAAATAGIIKGCTSPHTAPVMRLPT